MGNATSDTSDKNATSGSSGHKKNRKSSSSSGKKKQPISASGTEKDDVATRAQKVAAEWQAGFQNGIRKLEENDHPAAQLIDSFCGPYLDSSDIRRQNRSYDSCSDDDDASSCSDEETTVTEEQQQLRRTNARAAATPRKPPSNKRDTGQDDAGESVSYLSQSDYESTTVESKSDVHLNQVHNNNNSRAQHSLAVSSLRRRSKSTTTDESSLDTANTEDESAYDTKKVASAAPIAATTSLLTAEGSTMTKPLASSFAKRCYFTKAGIGKTTQHYEGLTLTGNVVLMLAAAMKLKGCPTICDEDLRRVEQTYPNQFSRLPDELLLSSGWRRISKYCHFSNKPIPDGVPFFHSKQRLHPSGGYYFLLAAAVGMVRPIDVEPLNRDTLVLLETDFPSACDAAPKVLIQDPSQWTLVDRFCFFSGGPINTDEDVYYQADFDGNPIYMLAFLSPSLTPEELYKLDNASLAPGLQSVAAVEEVESIYDLTDRDFDDLKLYHLGPCRALPPYILQPQAWTKVLPPHFLEAKRAALLRAREYEARHATHLQHNQHLYQQQLQQQQQLQMQHNSVMMSTMVTPQYEQSGTVVAEEPGYYNPSYLLTPSPPMQSAYVSPNYYNTNVSVSASKVTPLQPSMPPSAGLHSASPNRLMTPLNRSASPQRMQPMQPMQPQLQQNNLINHHLRHPSPVQQPAPFPSRMQQQQQPPPYLGVDTRHHEYQIHHHAPSHDEEDIEAQNSPMDEAQAMDPPDDEPPSLSKRDAFYSLHSNNINSNHSNASYYSREQEEYDDVGQSNSSNLNTAEQYYQEEVNTKNYFAIHSTEVDSAGLANSKSDQYYEQQEYSNSPAPTNSFTSPRSSEYFDEFQAMSPANRTEPSVEVDESFEPSTSIPHYPSKNTKNISTAPQSYVVPEKYEEEPLSPVSEDDLLSPGTSRDDREGLPSTTTSTSKEEESGSSPTSGTSGGSQYSSSPKGLLLTGSGGSGSLTSSNLPPRSPGGSDFSRTSAMKGAQELLRRNRLRRLEAARGRNTNNVREEPMGPEDEDSNNQNSLGNPSLRTDSESAGTWETNGSEITSVVSGSSVWTDNVSNPDRSSRRALILQMAKARMRSHTLKTNPTSPTEEKKEPGEEAFDLTGDLD